jgi:hypothetical protein
MTNNMNDGTWIMKEEDLFAQAKLILAQQKATKKSWGLAEHAHLLTNSPVEHGLPETMRAKFEKAIRQCGVAGNSSQFRQWLQKGGISIGPRQMDLSPYENL